MMLILSFMANRTGSRMGDGIAASTSDTRSMDRSLTADIVATLIGVGVLPREKAHG